MITTAITIRPLSLHEACARLSISKCAQTILSSWRRLSQEDVIWDAQYGAVTCPWNASWYPEQMLFCHVGPHVPFGKTCERITWLCLWFEGQYFRHCAFGYHMKNYSCTNCFISEGYYLFGPEDALKKGSASMSHLVGSTPQGSPCWVSCCVGISTQSSKTNLANLLLFHARVQILATGFPMQRLI